MHNYQGGSYLDEPAIGLDTVSKLADLGIQKLPAIIIAAAMPTTIPCFFHVRLRYPANSRIKAFSVKYHFVFAPNPTHLIPCFLASIKARNTW